MSQQISPVANTIPHARLNSEIMDFLPTAALSATTPGTVMNGQHHQLEQSIHSDPMLIHQSDYVDRPKVTVVIPAINEAENLPHVLPRIPEWVYEVVLVDGYSTDNTIEVARNLWPGVVMVHGFLIKLEHHSEKRRNRQDSQ